LLCHGTVCVVGKMRDLILQLSKSSIYSTKPKNRSDVLLNHSDKINEEILRKPSAININNFFFMFLLACIYDELINGNKIDDKSN
ncbi:hypothetical protein, partial [Serratia nevei]|uniref:hypothetical protein n=1 Tax=Serratia nevei TaxID=2703794 RepID=UPI00254A66C7